MDALTGLLTGFTPLLVAAWLVACFCTGCKLAEWGTRACCWLGAHGVTADFLADDFNP
jgi:hypothetical protein